MCWSMPALPSNGGTTTPATRTWPTRIPSRMMTATDGAEFCQPECIDGVFLKHLEEKAATITGNTVIVLHQIGSHGPSYWLRYPTDAERFSPACQTPELTECSTEEIVNAYDNTIAYTDTFLSQVIDLLDSQDRVIPAMYYVSRPRREPGRRRALPAWHALFHGARRSDPCADGGLDVGPVPRHAGAGQGLPCRRDRG